MTCCLNNVLVTGGAGFIGSAFIRYVLQKESCIRSVVNLDLLTYAGDLNNVKEVENDCRYHFVKGDICDEDKVRQLCSEHQIDTIVHFAAESHVDRSIEGPLAFYRTNVEGTLHLLEVVRSMPHIHFHHVSTDEVYGSLGKEGSFNEKSLIQPNSPYAASKAASDHLVRAYANTYGIKTTISHCSNNYGPYQNEEKFLPRMLACLINKKPLPMYGNGQNIRDWLYVEDHVEAIVMILKKGVTGEVYDVGGGYEVSNLTALHELIKTYCQISGESENEMKTLISYVPDRLGHDFRYSIDPSKIVRELCWSPRHQFSQGIVKTVEWYMQKNIIARCGG
jgi:dTDP-glucose 4,6-dehydratase